MSQKTNLETATLAGGCFWCTEAIFKRLKGVESVTSGYSGGNVKNPTYEQVCLENTGHAEAIQIKFDPSIISFEKLLEVFFKLHDPTTLNRQGNDVGTSYRSAIFYHADEQKKIAEKVKSAMQKIYKDKQSLRFSSSKTRTAGLKIVTEIVPYKNFYEAENYHQNYYENYKNQPYCQLVIDPKIQKLYKLFPEKIKNQ